MTVGIKLTTQNLFTSAAFYETREPLDWSSIQDLCVLINLFCLYDNVLVLGRDASPRSLLQQNRSSIYEVLDDQEFVQVDAVGDKEMAKKVSSAARSHLRSVLPAGANINKYDELLSGALRPDEVYYGLTWKPDRSNKDNQNIREWENHPPSDRAFLAKLKNGNEMQRSRTFMARTFLYLGYMNVRELAFVPDTTRAPLVDMISKREDDLRGSLLEVLQNSNKEQRQTQPDEIWDTITPLAAIVLHGARTRDAIARQMADLRDQMTDMRVRLRKLEEAALGVETRTEEKAALRKWHEINKEISRSFGEGGSLLTRKNVFDFGAPALEAGLDPTNPAKWLKLMAALPFEALGRLINRRPVGALIGIKNDIPGTGAMKKDIKRLFGDVIKS
jgi:hypothetical protein